MSDRSILLGVIGRPHGVRGFLHVHSYTAEPTDLTAYGPLDDGKGRQFRLRWQSEGIARVAEIVAGKPVWAADREAAALLTNTRLYVARELLPSPDEDEFYLVDLVGLAAFDPAGAPIGTIDAVHDYGAGASLEIGRLIIPFTRASVPEVDIAAGRVVVQPPEEVEVKP
ncbi:MAG: ribosome maturation factor RimM [Alphaproteobacteria bacterium]|nr:ribosome maturation factor RimM [Alphaproteobacteria bacterium]